MRVLLDECVGPRLKMALPCTRFCLGFVSVRVPKNRVEHYLPMIDELNVALNNVKCGQAVHVVHLALA